MRNRAWDRGWGCDDARACAGALPKVHVPVKHVAQHHAAQPKAHCGCCTPRRGCCTRREDTHSVRRAATCSRTARRARLSCTSGACCRNSFSSSLAPIPPKVGDRIARQQQLRLLRARHRGCLRARARERQVGARDDVFGDVEALGRPPQPARNSTRHEHNVETILAAMRHEIGDVARHRPCHV